MVKPVPSDEFERPFLKLAPLAEGERAAAVVSLAIRHLLPRGLTGQVLDPPAVVLHKPDPDVWSIPCETLNTAVLFRPGQALEPSLAQSA